MKILQQPVKVKKGNRVLIKFSRPTSVFLMTDMSFKRYKAGGSFKRLGGEFSQSPAEFVVPYGGTWHAVIETGGHKNPQPITGSVEILPPLRKEVPYFDEEAEYKKDHANDPVAEEEPSKDEAPSNSDESDNEGNDEDDDEKND